MYAVEVSREFVAEHYLTVPSAGPEAEPHSHDYEAAVRLSGAALDDHGFLVDIDRVRASVDRTVEGYRDRTLNDLPEFDGENPSAERLAERFADRLLEDLDAPLVDRVQVTIREEDDAAATFERAA